jgi:ABC-type amino acid transport substrate-binding protein
MKKAFVFLCFLAFLAADVDTLAAQPLHDAVPHPGKKLIVGVVQDPPYIIKERDGQWSGLNVEIWKSIVRDLRIDYEFREMTFKELLVSKEKVLDVLSLQP